MSSKYLISPDFIPQDGSNELIEQFEIAANKENTEIYVFPDVHYKRGARVTNGLLTASNNKIYPSMLGVTNCGFTFGKIEGASLKNRNSLESIFQEYSNILKAYSSEKIYSNSKIKSVFFDYLKKEYASPRNEDFFSYLDVSGVEDLLELFEKNFSKDWISIASKTLGTLGGGNHFFEIHYVEESYVENIKNEEIYFILHSDSIAVGDKVNLLFSNLSELHHYSGLKKKAAVLINRYRQAKYFLPKSNIVFSDIKNLCSLIFSLNDFRSIDSKSPTGKILLLNYFFASVFGEMNRDFIINGCQEIINKLGYEYILNKEASHSHDSISITKNSLGDYKVVQRNGVQDIRESKYYCLPGALGTESYLMSNTNNCDVYYSANHGVGRMLDKHLAKNEFSEQNTLEKLKEFNMKLYRVGRGNIGEQNSAAFKNVYSITEEMEKHNLGKRAAKLRPIASLKG